MTVKREELNRDEIISRRGYRKDIRGDAFSLYISNYPVTSHYIRNRIGDKNKVLAELCCSVGVTLEYLAPSFKQVIGVDIDHGILEDCRKNMHAAGMQNAKLILGDISDESTLQSFTTDIVIYDIPYWYSNEEVDTNYQNPPFEELISKIRKHLTHDIMIFAPVNMEFEFFKNIFEDFEFEKVFIKDRHDRNHIYLGALIQLKGETEIRL